MAKLYIDLSGQGGLGDKYFGDTDQITPSPNRRLLGDEGVMAQGTFNPFTRFGFLSPTVTTLHSVTADQTLNAVMGSSQYDHINDDAYMAERGRQIFKADGFDDLTLSRVEQLPTSTSVDDLEIYQVNGVRKLFYVYKTLNSVDMYFDYSAASGGATVSYLLVGGGGGAGSSSSSDRASGGGGGGEVVSGSFTGAVSSLSVVVGAGGAAGNDGSNSSIGTGIFRVLVVGGGGGGGGSSPNGTYAAACGGGGGGGVYSNTAIWLPTTNTITVGAGGAAGNPDSGARGGESSLGTKITAPGGGGGGGMSAASGKTSAGDGASGGGASARPTGGFMGEGTIYPGWGSNGGQGTDNAAGGGGGNQAEGADASGTVSGAGGEGLSSNISGSSIVYGSGGGGGTGDSITGGAGGTGAGGSGGSATANRGGGGGGGYRGGGQAGGSGVVIIRVATAAISSVTSTGATVTTDGSDTIYTYTTSGVFNFTYVSTAYGTARGGGRGGAMSDAFSVSTNTSAGGIAYTGGGGGSSYSDSSAYNVFNEGGNGTFDGGDGVQVGASGDDGGGGGGAGAGENGSAGSGGTGGAGGDGVESSISGAAVYYGGGGGGGGVSAGGAGGNGGGGGGIDGVTGTAGTANRGGGGGGTTNATGGAGGSGVVIFSYPTGSFTATGGTITTAGGNTIHTFTSNGTFAITAIGASSIQFGGAVQPAGSATPVVADSDELFASGSATTITSGSMTVGGATETVYAFVFTFNAVEPSSATWNSVAMTKAAGGSGTTGNLTYGWALFYKSNPSVATATVVATYPSAVTNRLMVSGRITGAHTTVPFGTVTSKEESLNTRNTLTPQSLVAYALPLTMGVTDTNGVISAIGTNQVSDENGTPTPGDYNQSHYNVTITSATLEVGIADLPYQNADIDWLSTVPVGKFSNTTISSYNFMRVADNGYAYLFNDNQVHKIDGTTFGGTGGTVSPNVLLFPSYFRLTDAVDYRGNMFMVVHQNTTDATSRTQTNFSTPCGVYVWGRETTVVRMSDYIPVEGVRVIKRIYVAPSGAVRLITVSSDGLTQIREFNGSVFQVIKEMGVGAAPQYVDSLTTAGNKTMWLAPDGSIYCMGKISPSLPESLARIGEVLAPSSATTTGLAENIIGGAILYGSGTSDGTVGYRNDRQGLYLGYSDGSIKVRRTYPFDVNPVASTNQTAHQGDIYTGVKAFPHLSVVNNMYIYMAQGTVTGENVQATLKIYFNGSATAWASKTITRDDIAKGYKIINIGKPYVNSIQLEIEYATGVALSDTYDFHPLYAEIDYTGEVDEAR